MDSKIVTKINTLLLIALVSFGLFISCSDDNNGGGMDPDPDTNTNIVETATDDGNFDILVQAIQDAGLADALQGTGPFTVFAPTDDAFDGLPDGVLESLTTEQLAEILQFHVISGAAISSGSLAATQDVETLLGEEILVQANGGVTVNGSANVITADVEASNGIIHAIDSILLPQSIRIALGLPNIVDQAVELGNFTTLAGALEQVGLTTTLKYTGDYTVFAPSDDAFSALPDGLLGSLTDEQLTEILTYHVLSGEVFADDLGAEQAPASLEGGEVFVTKDGDGNVTVNGSASVVAADVDVTNGVIHAIDQVILPDAYGTVVDAASKRYDFETLVSAVVDAGLADALSAADGTFTVFAPTDDAFAALPEGLLASLSVEQLATILSYHVLPVEVASGDLEDEQAPASLTDEAVYVTVADGNVTVNGSAGVVAADIATSNGTIHAIDQVILPNAFLDIVGIASKNYMLSTLVTLVADADLVSTLQGDGPFTVFAPTNAAFEAVSETLETLTPEQVEEVLLYHTAATEALSGSLSDGMTVTTVQGEDITVNIDGEGNVTLNGSVNVTTVDLQGTNGVIHIIDGVLLPPSYTD
ncbi:fasciclin domain-containing protein [Rhodohalobacter sulfatireducens]|uniref:Fasciclin domain-containing protein n=1 Tax=Rhodohalobacter sulfatireducens TaxID=2911366 RepID=A0ABS9KB51_9BACT|nr:fasciclin domain-containing protein [Rhodohalobacter sulfatireducens]MCG2588063.1 fasciclin domain-containing protein [Rhodohalobacter sulfatireducens]